jgi:enoyl-CoA hydratase
VIGWVDADGIGVVTLDRPPVNALDWDAKRELLALVGSLGERADLRVVIVRSSLARVFCAGSDLHELASDHATPGVATERTRFELELWRGLSSLPQVSIAAIEGHALGSGLELAIACDFRIAGGDASLGLPEVKIGGAPGVQTLARLPQLVGVGVARRLLLTGETLGAAEAHAVGLVDEVTASGKAEEVARRFAALITLRPRSSIRFLKDTIAASADATIDEVARRVEAGVEALFQAPEMREGIAAFREKRPADFDVVLDDAGRAHA